MSYKKRKKDDEISSDSWLATYSDTITLLLTFFILLYSISSVDSEKLKGLSAALQNALKGETSVTELENLDNIKIDIESDAQKESNYEDLVDKLNNVVEKNSLQEVVKVREDDRGVVLQLDESIMFDLGKSNLKEGSKHILSIITKIITGVENDVLVEGNTDDIPIRNSEFSSNWELSTARATGVVRYFIEEQGISPTRFAVKGYGEFKPLVENNSNENRAINRRVDILIVEQKEKK